VTTYKIQGNRVVELDLQPLPGYPGIYRTADGQVVRRDCGRCFSTRSDALVALIAQLIQRKTALEIALRAARDELFDLSRVDSTG
jgi:hypothetical protein